MCSGAGFSLLAGLQSRSGGLRGRRRAWPCPTPSLAILVAVAAFAQQTIPQGQVIRVRAEPPAASARMDGRIIRLFTQDDGTTFGLMPVAALAKPGDYDLEILDGGGKVLRTSRVTVRDAHFRKQNVQLGTATAELRPSPGEMETVHALRDAVTDTRYWHEPFTKPVPGCMISPFGVQRLYNGKPSGNFHSGLDLRSPAGRPIRAAAAGVVRFARSFNIHGNVVGIDHGQGLASVYLHMSKFVVKDGDRVNAGDVIGYVGMTGRANGPHLHWTVYANGVPVNPAQWVRAASCTAPKPKRRK